MPRDRCGKSGEGTGSAVTKISAQIPVIELCDLRKLLNLALSTVSFCTKGMKVRRLRQLMKTIYEKCVAQEIVASNCCC